jgi:hypothetical protein
MFKFRKMEFGPYYGLVSDDTLVAFGKKCKYAANLQHTHIPGGIYNTQKQTKNQTYHNPGNLNLRMSMSRSALLILSWQPPY